MKFNEKKAVKKPLTAEEQDALKKARAAARKADNDAAHVLGQKVGKLTNDQLRSELKRVGKAHEGGLGAALASALLIVLDTTKGTSKTGGKLHPYPL